MNAARAVVLDRGARAVTIAAIAGASGAPTGSIYYRFRSVDEVLARAWMRAIRRVQEALLSSGRQEPVAAAVSGALADTTFACSSKKKPYSPRPFA